MNLVKIGAGVLNQTPMDWDGNAARVRAAIDDARDQGVSLLCLPELCITGYGCEDAFYSVGLQETAKQVLLELLPATSGMMVSVGLPLFHRGGLYNMACLLADGQILGLVGKQNLASEGLHYEPRWFKAWPDGVTSETRIGAITYPIGDLLFDCGGLRIGFEICEDAWVANRPGGQLAAAGVDVVLNPSASHFAFGKHQVRERFVLDGSRAFAAIYVYANLLGNEAGRAIYDGDAMIASCGQMIATGSRFSMKDYDVTAAVVDLDAVRLARARIGSFRPQLDEDPRQVRCQFHFPRQLPEPAEPTKAAWEHSERLKEEEFTRAITLGLFDYLRKSRSHGFVVSLSGGADSSATATLCALMVRMGWRELGGRFVDKLAYIPKLTPPQACSDDATVIAELTNRLLLCAYQATDNSSPATRAAAVTVAKAIGAAYLELEIQSIVDAYVALVSDSLGRPLTWERDDIALQNIQARARGPSIWMFANLRQSLLLATSNRSEAAVGYATMDGDTCGGLSPIAGIDKAFLRRWLAWMETDGPQGGHPLPALSAVTRLAPTAELRPLDKHQTDEEDLMPYDLLDAIERAAIRDKQTPIEAFEKMRVLFPQYAISQLVTWIERFYTLWARNQWKRERYAPSFHVDDENLDPKTWCRFPILSGGFVRELRELRQYVDQLA